MNKSDAVKNVAIATIESIVDEAMQHLPSDLDLALPGNKEKLRSWMVRVCGIVTQQNAYSFSRAAANAIEEASNLAVNPDYHAQKKRNQERYAAMRKKSAAQKNAERAFERITDATVKM